PSGGVTVFVVNSGVTLNVSDLTIQHGNASVTDSGDSRVYGGGIFNNGGTLTLTNSTLRRNVNTGSNSGDSAGLYSKGGSVVVQGSTISENRTPNGGGSGILNNGGTLTVTNSTISGNNGSGFGGGILNHG